MQFNLLPIRFEFNSIKPAKPPRRQAKIITIIISISYHWIATSFSSWFH